MGIATSRYFKTLLVLGAFAATTPIFAGYFVSAQLLVLTGLLALKCWRQKRREALPPREEAPSSPTGASAFLLAKEIFRPLDVGLVVLLATWMVATLVAWAGSDGLTLGKALKPSFHLLLKWGLLWVSLRAGMLLSMKQPRCFELIGKWLAAWMLMHFFYCLVQRYTGVHLSRGIGAVLPSHQFAYGVFRISGFMGHPLTLAYNLVVVVIAALGLAKMVEGGRAKFAWRSVAVLAALVLLMSGSRFPLFALGCGLLVSEWQLWRRHLGLGLGLAALALAALVLEGSALLRMQELFDEQVPLSQRFSRLIYWQAYWTAFTEKPLAGYGRAALEPALERLYTAFGAHDRIFSAHNIFLQHLADAGLIGLTGLLAMCLGLWRLAKRALVFPGGSALMGLVVAGLISGLMQNNFRDSEFVYTFWYFTAALVACAAVRAKDA